jgi:hypothetical protein
MLGYWGFKTLEIANRDGLGMAVEMHSKLLERGVD